MGMLSIGQYSALDVGVEDYIGIAAANGCRTVSLLVSSPNPQAQLPLVTADNLDSVRQCLQATGLGVLNAECFMLTPDTDVAGFRPALELASALNARGVTALLYDADEERVRFNLQSLCAMARSLGLLVNIEFMPFSPRWGSLQEATALVEELDQANLGLGIDLLHLVRSGGSVEDLAAVPPQLVHYAQVCDSADGTAHKDYAEEAGANRLAPGAGVLPVQAFVAALPPGTPVEIEVPQPPGMPAAERLAAIIGATREQLRAAGL